MRAGRAAHLPHPGNKGSQVPRLSLALRTLAKAAFMVALAAVAMTAGCGARPLPDPRATVAVYRDAAARGDAAAVHRLLTDDARLAYGQDGTRRLLDDARGEKTSSPPLRFSRYTPGN